MSKHTTYKCDRCGKEFSDRSILKCLSMGFGEYPGDSSWERSIRVDWCLECLSQFGLRPPNKPDGSTTQIEPSKWETVLREIVRKEIAASVPR